MKVYSDLGRDRRHSDYPGTGVVIAGEARVELDGLTYGEEINDMHEVIEDDVAFYVWSAKSEKCEISLGMGTMFVKNGVISR